MIEVGLIGFGLAGRCFHAPVISAVNGLRLSAILQRTGDSAAQLYPHARIVRTVEELLSIDSLELIVVATPNQTHFPLAKCALEAGRHVVVDKPFATTVAEALELIHIARRRNRILTVYHNRRFDADFQALRKIATAGELGRILRFENTYDRYRPTSKPNAWREQPGLGSGVLFDLAPHLLDQAFMLFGQPIAISADIRTERSGFSTDDAFDILLHYPGGTRILLRATMLAATPRPRFVVLAEQGSFVKRDFDPLENSLRHDHVPADDCWLLEKSENFGELALADGKSLITRKIPSFGDWREFYAGLREAILGNAPPPVTPQQALDVMLGLKLAMESHEKCVTIPWHSIQI